MNAVKENITNLYFPMLIGHVMTRHFVVAATPGALTVTNTLHLSTADGFPILTALFGIIPFSQQTINELLTNYLFSLLHVQRQAPFNLIKVFKTN